MSTVEQVDAAIAAGNPTEAARLAAYIPDPIEYRKAMERAFAARKPQQCLDAGEDYSFHLIRARQALQRADEAGQVFDWTAMTAQLAEATHHAAMAARWAIHRANARE